MIAKSYEMKAAGVATGMPIWDALVKCPTGVYVKRDFRWYEILSRLMLGVVREWSPRVEYYSIDEFFFAAMPGPGQTFQDLAMAIRDEVRERVGVPVTVGIARTRTLAKLISDAAKPNGALAVVDRRAEEELLVDRPVTEITGIAGRRGPALAMGDPHLPRPGAGRPPAGPVAVDRRGRDAVVGAQRRGCPADPDATARAQSTLARRQFRRVRPPSQSSFMPGWCATSNG